MEKRVPEGKGFLEIERGCLTSGDASQVRLQRVLNCDCSRLFATIDPGRPIDHSSCVGYSQEIKVHSET